MATNFSPVLGMGQHLIAQGDIRSYEGELALESQLNSHRDKIDLWAGFTTASFYSLFQVSGSTSDNLGDAGGVGAEFNPTCDRVIQEVVAFAATSGSGGVTTIDCLVQQGVGGNFSSIFGPLGGPSNAAMRVALSSSLGNYGIATSHGFVSGTNMVWPRGTILKTQLTTAAGAAGPNGQKGLIIQVRWTPSGSFSNRTAQP